jgi:hypothetical protein
MHDLAALILRLVVGGVLAGYGAQKLFGWIGGGALTALGFLHPLGPIGVIAAAGSVGVEPPTRSWARCCRRRATAEIVGIDADKDQRTSRAGSVADRSCEADSHVTGASWRFTTCRPCRFLR